MYFLGDKILLRGISFKRILVQQEDNNRQYFWAWTGGPQTDSEAGGVQEITITKKLILFVSNSRTKYHQYLEERKRKEEVSKRGEKRKAVEESLVNKKSKKKRLEEIKYLESEVDRLTLQAEEEENFKYLIQSNAVKLIIKDWY